MKVSVVLTKDLAGMKEGEVKRIGIFAANRLVNRGDAVFEGDVKPPKTKPKVPPQTKAKKKK